MPIDELIKYHQSAISYLEDQEKSLEEGDKFLIPIRVNLDFHRRGVITLMAAKAMFEKAEAAEPKEGQPISL